MAATTARRHRHRHRRRAPVPIFSPLPLPRLKPLLSSIHSHVINSHVSNRLDFSLPAGLCIPTTLPPSSCCTSGSSPSIMTTSSTTEQCRAWTALWPGPRRRRCRPSHTSASGLTWRPSCSSRSSRSRRRRPSRWACKGARRLKCWLASSQVRKGLVVEKPARWSCPAGGHVAQPAIPRGSQPAKPVPCHLARLPSAMQPAPSPRCMPTLETASCWAWTGRRWTRRACCMC